MPDNKNFVARENLKKFWEHLGLNQSKFAKSIGIPQSNMSEIIRGKKNITEKIIIAILNSYNDLNVNWLFTNQGEMLLSNVNQANSNNILVPISAQAGYLGEYGQEWINQEAQKVSVPGIKGDARTFEVRGDSMYPHIKNKDLVVCLPIERPHEIKSGRIYVIVTRTEGILIKFATFLGSSLQLKSSEEYISSTIQIELEDVREIWEVKYRITESITDASTLYEERFNSIEAKLNELLKNR